MALGCRSRSRGCPPPARIAARWPSQRPSAVHRRRCGLTERPRGAHQPVDRASRPPPRLRLASGAPGAGSDHVSPWSLPSLGLSWVFAPPPFYRRVSTPRHPEERLSGCSSQPQRLVPSSRFRTTSTAFATRRVRACCSPVPDLGFVEFVCADAEHNSRELHADRAETPPDATPSEGFPSSIAVPRHRGRCPLVVRHPLRRAGFPPPQCRHCGVRERARRPRHP